MIQKLGVPLTFYFFFVESKLGKTGLTVTADVYETPSNGASASIVSGGACTEIGGGLYKYVLAAGSVDANGEYAAVGKTSTTTVDAQWVPALWTTPAWLTTLAAASVSFTSPIADDGTITLVRGDDYFEVDGAALNFTFTGLPSIAGGSIKLTFRPANRAPIVYTGTVLSATQARWELTAAQTRVRESGSPAYSYDNKATLSNGHVRTFQEGDVYVRQDVTP